MDIKTADLNLLVAFDAMVKHRSVTRAAEAVGLSQPAMSATVARLRSLFGDPLFVRSGSEMRPTIRALELSRPVGEVLATIESEILQRTSFDPAATDRTFSIATPDIGEVRFLPTLLPHFSRQAPHAMLRTISMPRHAIAAALEEGEADLAIGYFPDLHKPGFFQQKVFSNELVCIMRRDHATIGASLSLKAYLAAGHAVVRPEGRQHAFEQFLEMRGIRRRVVVEIAHFMSLLPVLAASDLLATVPRDLAEVCAQFGPIKILESPIKAPRIEVHQIWHGRFQKDPANVWLRTAIYKLLRR
jgi:DNA-binding transcriptional LysR family regulator